MSSFKRLTAFLICIILICGCLASCVNPNTGNTEPPQSDEYVATIRIKYATNDNKMKAAIDALGTPTTTLTVNGDNMKLESSAVIDDVSVCNDYTYLDGVLYQAKTVTVGDKSISSYERAQMSADQTEQFVSKAGPGASIGMGDFLVHDKLTSTSGDTVTYECSDMIDESRDSLCDIISQSFAAMGATVRIDSASYQLETRNGRNHSSVLSCDFVITVDGVNYELTLHLYYDYNYDADANVSAPENADTYKEVSFEEIVG